MTVVGFWLTRPATSIVLGVTSSGFGFAFWFEGREVAESSLLAHCRQELVVVNVRVAREEVHLAIDCVIDQVIFAQDVMTEIMVLNAKLARERNHIASDCVIDQVLFAQAVMTGVVVLNARLARERTQNIRAL